MFFWGVNSRLVNVGIIAVAVIFIIGYLVFSYNFLITNDEAGFLEGGVSFIGTPCATSGETPLCDGPYPDYEIEIFREDGKTLETRTVSNKDGSYFVLLLPGRYVIYTQNGIGPENRKENFAEVAANKATKLDLIIDTGIR